MNSVALHPGGVAVVTQSHSRRDDEGDAALRVEELLGGAGHVVAVEGLHGAGGELVAALGEDVVQGLAAAPDLDADVPAGRDHDAKRFLGVFGRAALTTAGVEQRAHQVRVAVYHAPTELPHVWVAGYALDELGVVVDDALAAMVVVWAAALMVCLREGGVSLNSKTVGGERKRKWEWSEHTGCTGKSFLKSPKVIICLLRVAEEDGGREDFLQQVIDTRTLEEIRSKRLGVQEIL